MVQIGDPATRSVLIELLRLAGGRLRLSSTVTEGRIMLVFWARRYHAYSRSAWGCMPVVRTQ